MAKSSARSNRPKRRMSDRTAHRSQLLRPYQGDGPAATIRVGTASWTDPGFIADWYPKRTAGQASASPWYATHFNLVEVNSSFYAVPRSAARRSVVRTDARRLRLRRQAAPAAVAAQYAGEDAAPRPALRWRGALTRRRLTPKLETALVKVFLESLEPMIECGKLGALLLQLSPSFSPRKHALTELDPPLGTAGRSQSGGGVAQPQLGRRRTACRRRSLISAVSRSRDGGGGRPAGRSLHDHAELRRGNDATAGVLACTRPQHPRLHLRPVCRGRGSTTTIPTRSWKRSPSGLGTRPISRSTRTSCSTITSRTTHRRRRSGFARL